MTHYKTLHDYCQAINISTSKHTHFDIRRFVDNMPTVKTRMEPFRHEFYAIAIKITGQGAAYTGSTTHFPDGSVIFFNSPFQLISWDIAPDWDGYYLMFTQDFVSRSKSLIDLLEDFPYLRLDQSIPLRIDASDVEFLDVLFQKIHTEYYSDHDDKFRFIEAYVLLLLNYIQRYFSEQLDSNFSTTALRKADIKLVSRFQSQVEMSFYPDTRVGETSDLFSVQYYANQLGIHPNHLNTVVKSVTGQTALQIIHTHLIQLAKTYLVQTDMSVQQIANTLHFESPNYFSRFFKKNTDLTPLQYRQQHSL